MANSILVFPPGFRVTDASGNPVSGAKMLFFESGTSTPKPVFSDKDLQNSLGSTVYAGSSGFPVASQGSSTTVAVYTGTDAYKLRITTSADVVIWEQDAIVGAPSITAAAAEAPFISVITTGADHTFDADDRGTLYNASTNTLTFPAAATLGDGWWVHIRNGGSSTGRVVLSAASGIAYQGTSYTTMYLEPGQARTIVCDGTAYRVAADAVLYSPAGLRPNTPGVIKIKDRITAEPATSIGSRYIVTASYGSFSTHDVVEEVASGVFIGYTPATDAGWLAYVDDEDQYYAFVGSAWVPFFSTINNLSEDTTPDTTADFVATYDTSAGLPKKVKPQNFKQAGGLQLLTSNTVSSAATLDIVLTSYTGYRGFLLKLASFIPVSDDVELWLRFSTDGGGTFDATGYSYAVAGVGSGSGGSVVSKSETSGAKIVIAGGNSAGEAVSSTTAEGGVNGDVWLDDLTTSRWHRSRSFTCFQAATTQTLGMTGSGTRETSQDTDAIRILFESGNIASGKWALYGYI